jgi:hypothetical protein
MLLSFDILSLKRCKKSLKNLFEDPTSKFWAIFVAIQLKNFKDTIKIMECSETTSFESGIALKVLKKKMKYRRDFKFIPHEAKVEKEKLKFK